MPADDTSRLLVKVARLYYEQELTQQDIAAKLRLSRQKVQRLLKEAYDTGVVQITIQPLRGSFAELEDQLESRYGLKEAIVVETTAYDDQSVVAREVGVGAAGYLIRVIQPEDRIVVSWGGSLLGVVNALFGLPRSRLPAGIEVVQGLGGLGEPNSDMHAADLTRRMADVLGGKAVLLPAPGIAGSVDSLRAFQEDRYIAQALEKGRSASLCVMGIGAPREDSLLIQSDTIVSYDELKALVKRGAVGDINLRYFDARGQAVDSDLDARVVGLTLQDIRQVEHVIGVAGGAAKFDAIRGALIGRLIDVLVTDDVTGRRLIE